MHLKIAMLGYGNVARALARLLLRKTETLQRDYDLTFSITGIATRSRGSAINPQGLDITEALRVVDSGDKLDMLHQGPPLADTFAFIEACPADLIMEATWLNPQTGQPATDYVRAALQAGRHVVTANKGPVAFAYRELKELARQRNLGFFFESTVMDGAPVLAIGREALLATTVERVRGVLNSTTNYILDSLEQGVSFEAAVKQTQDMGIAEADPTNDLEGWDATVKTVVLANVLMGADLRPADVDRTGITGVTTDDAQAALAAGERIKLLCEAVREGDQVRASVRPTRLPLSDPLSQVNKTSSAVTFETDTLHHVTMIEGDTDPTTTAYGMLVDMINIARGRHLDPRT
ncbi:MAG: homoserine dehydrogenase [Chloroflexi bacterium]|jgi:homoserine dehydrogenase|nr:homoserine dehydrogenase [Chloroflexota bacterium]